MDSAKLQPVANSVSDEYTDVTDKKDIVINQSESKPNKSAKREVLGILSEKYKLVRELGHGSQGHVYEANRRSDGRKVAIKELRIDSVTNWKSYTLFKREGDVLGELNIDGVAKVYETAESLDDENPSAYIVQEFIQGANLQDLLNKGHRFSRKQVCDLVIQLLDILEKLHSHEPPVIHRDIKPSNLIVNLNSNGGIESVHLIDFGAVSNPQIQGGGSTVAGTYGYMAPEQLMGKPCPATDTYAVAALVSYLLSGISPSEMDVEHFKLNIDPHLKSQPKDLVRVLNQMLEVRVEERLCNIPEIREYFKEFKKEKFSITKIFANDYGSDKYDETLNDFYYPGQKTAQWLWDKLPENQRSLTKALSKALESPNSEQNKSLIGKEHNKDKSKVTTENDKFLFSIIKNLFSIIKFLFSIIKNLFSTIVMTIVCIFLLVCTPIIPTTTDDIAFIIFLEILLFAAIFMCIYYLNNSMCIYDLKDTIRLRRKQMKLENVKEINANSDQRLRIIKDILWYGKKTNKYVCGISLVSDNIELVDGDNQLLEVEKVSKKSQIEPSDYQIVYWNKIKRNVYKSTVRQRPLYKIEYYQTGKYGKKSAIYTHKNPIKYLHIGDKIPFLELSLQNCLRQAMPYPWPLDEITDCIYLDNEIQLASGYYVKEESKASIENKRKTSQPKAKKQEKKVKKHKAKPPKDGNMHGRNTSLKNKSR